MYLNASCLYVVAETGQPALHIGPNDEENLTVLVSVNADGEVAVPMAVFARKRLPAAHILNKMPKNWCFGKSDTGWMTCWVSYEFIARFYPYLKSKNVEFPVIVFLDNHITHLSLPLSEFCEKHGIIIVCFCPNCTHFLQVLHVVFFRPLKQRWSKTLDLFRLTHKGRDIKKEDIPNTLQEIFDGFDFIDGICNGFRSCGLYPFGPDNVDFTKLVTNKVEKLNPTYCFR